MPELPEVETIVRAIEPRARGRVIRNAEILSERIRRGKVELVAGQRIHEICRHGKFIVMRLDSGFLVIHLGMTGKLVFNAEPGPYTRAVFTLDKGALVYDDVRMFGRIEYSKALPERVARLGPEALAITVEEFQAAMRVRRTRIKALLLNQGFLRGLGNIYTDEALFRAGIHPRAIASRLSRLRTARLHQAIREILTLAIEHGGSSVSDYVNAEGRKGRFQLLHCVYGKNGEPCPNCGTSIRRILVAQRGTHYCPKCQRV